MSIQNQGAAVQPEVPSCPICQAWARPVFRSKIGKNIYRCRRAECRHFFTPAERVGQGVCSRDEDDIELDSERAAHQFAERNRKLLGLFEANIPSHASPVVMLDYGAGAAHVLRAFKSLRGDRIKIFCLEANPICHLLYKKTTSFILRTFPS